MVFSKDKRNESAVNEFKELVRKAKIEHTKTPVALVEEKLEDEDTPPVEEIVNSTLKNSSERFEAEISYLFDDITKHVDITENELRELRSGIVKTGKYSDEEKIAHLDIEKIHWKEFAETEKAVGRERKALLYDAMSDIAELKADQIRLTPNQRPQEKQAISIIEEETATNDLT